VTITKWHVANFAVLAIGLLIGKATSGSITTHLPARHDIITVIIDFGMAHLFLLTLIACLCLIAQLVSARPKGLHGLVVYFGIGLCVGRLFFQSR
jgi:hypothetical protein